MANFNNQYDYGLVPVGKFGSGSFYAPYNTNRQKALRIDPIGAGNFQIESGQDFYISVWIKYGTLNVTRLGENYPIIKYGSQNYLGGWEIGVGIYRVGQGYSALPYFAWVNPSTGQTQRLTTYFNGSNGNLIQPTNNFDHYEIFRHNGVIYFRFNGVNSTNTNQAYTGALGPPNAALVAQGTLSPDYAGIFVGSEQPYVAGQDNGAYIDDLFFARGASAVQNYNPDGSINDGKLTTTVLLYQFNGSIVDTVGMTQVADAIQLVSYSTFTATPAPLTRPDGASLISRFSLTANVSRVSRLQSAQAYLNVSSSLQANGIKPVGCIARLSSTTTLTARPVPYYPRPNGTWTSAIGMYSKYSSWQDIYIDNITVPSTTTVGSTQLFNFGGATVTSSHSANGDFVNIGGIIHPVTPGNYSLIVHRGSNITFAGKSFGVWDFNPLTGYSQIVIGTNSYNYSGNLNVQLPWNQNIGSKEIIRFVTNDQSYDIVISWQWKIINVYSQRLEIDYSRADKESGGLTLLQSGSFGFDYSYWPSQNIYTGTLSDPISIAFSFSKTTWAVTTPRSGGVSQGPPETLNIASITTSNGFNFTSRSPAATVTVNPYINAPTGTNLLITKTGFDYANNVVSTNPYVINNQNNVLGLYNSYGGVDNTGFITQAQAQLTSTTQFTVQATKVINCIGNELSSSQLTANLTKQVRTGAQLQSQSQFRVVVTKAMLTPAALTSTATLTAQARRFIGVQAQLTARSTATITPYNFTKYQASLQSSSQLVGTGLRIKQLQSQLLALASEVSAIARIRRGEIYLESRSTLNAQAVIKNSPFIPLSSATSLRVTNTRIRYADAHLQAISTATANNGHLRYADAKLTSTSSLTVIPLRIRPGQILLQAQTVQTAHTENSRKPGTSVHLSSTTQLVNNNQIIRLAQAHLNSSSVMYGTAGVVVYGYCSWQALSSELILGKTIDIDPYTTIRIQSESRGLIVLPESRIISINQETRVNIIKDLL
jgi:hypothetical protein